MKEREEADGLVARLGARLMAKVRAFRTLENAIRRMGFNLVAGVDEVGRGCLAGPVVAAAVVLNPDRYIPRICDSKTVTALERDELYDQITRNAGRLGRRIRLLRRDRHHQHPPGVAARDAARGPARWRRPLISCWSTPSGFPTCSMAQRAVIHGDSRCTAIAAASIVAKVTRDRMMLELHADRPPLRLRSAQRLRDPRSSAGRCAVWLLSGAPTVVPSAVAL